MSAAFLLAVISAVGTQANHTVRVHCPVGEPTRIVLPEPMIVNLSKNTREAFSVEWERGSHSRVLVLQPATHPATGILEVTGVRSGRVRVVLDTLAGGAARDVTLATELAVPPVRSPSRPERPASRSTARVAPVVNTAVPPASATTAGAGTSGAQAPAGPPPSGARTEPAAAERMAAGAQREIPAQPLLASEILHARVRPVGRVEALPGQREVELTDILEGERFLWLRFLVRGGAKARLDGAAWEHGPIASFMTETRDGHLHVVVQLPRGQVTRRTRVVLELDDGPRRFSLSAPWLSSLIKNVLGF